MTEIIELQINKIRPDPNQPRKIFDEKGLKIFGESYKTTGMINPIEIDENNMIVTGEQRWRGAKLVGLKTIKCIKLGKLTPEERLIRQLAENIARKSLTIWEQKDAIKKLLQQSTLEEGRYKIDSRYKGYEQIARKIGCSPTWIRQVLEVDKAPEIVQKAIKEKKMSVKVATEIMKLPEPKQQKQYAKGYLGEKKRGWTKDSNRVAEDIAFIRKSSPLNIERTANDKAMEILTSFSHLTHQINELKTMNKLDIKQSIVNRMLTSFGVLIYKTFPKLYELLKERGAKPDPYIKRLMELDKK